MSTWGHPNIRIVHARPLQGSCKSDHTPMT
uniref:Uncharacterized protein n=1 Tax=Arundo donax TaxID=35708 RepID=A0A0A9BLW1_ARUDO